ncbi:phosphoadenosine phosphosulfate reductase [Aeromonas veronii]|uniref:phosphoadenosine phosphosulfate reductase n=1 Tax=Aeromonas sp. R7-5 TaxID=3138477 RepID=UPI0034A294E3
MQQSLNFDVPVQPHAVLLRGDKWDSVWSTLADNEDLNFVDASRGTSLASLITSSVEAIHTALLDGWTMMLGYSSGKDSETVLHLFLMALIRAVRTGQNISQHHFVIHTDTLIESPEVRWLADKKLAALERFIAQENLPLTIVLAKPGITQSWTGRILTGRGLPTFTGSAVRQCSQDLKVGAAKRAKAAYMRELPKEVREKVCLMLGSRDAESSIRAANIAKQQGNAERVVKTKEGGELYVVKQWLASDVWELLLSSGMGPAYPLPSYLESNTETAELYKAATGECVWSAIDKKKSDACGARFGCWACQAVGLDKSMETLLATDPEKHGYMKGLNRIQRYLAKRRYAWEDRHPIGRTIYEGGYIKIQPDVYHPKFIERLLHVCCSMDYVEQQRAEKQADMLAMGLIEDNEWNRRMAEPQFRIVSEQALVHIDFMWSFHHFNDKPFQALEIYHRVWSFGELDLLEDEAECETFPQTPIPKPLWLKVARWGDGSLFDGLADPMAEMTYFDGGDDPAAVRVINTVDGKRRVVCFAEDDEVTVDPDSAAFIIWEEYPRLRESVLAGQYTPGSAAQFYLRFGVIQLAKGKGALYHKMMQRGQTYHQMGLTGYQTMEGLQQRKDLKVLSDAKYRDLVKRKIKGRLATVRWWLNLDLAFRYHLHHKTPTGLFIQARLDAEAQAEAREHQARWFNNVSGAMLGYSSAFGMSVMEGKEGAGNTDIRRYMIATRRKAYKALSELLEHASSNWAGKVIHELVKEYEGILAALNEGSALALSLDWLNLLSKRHPEVLHRHVRTMIKAIHRQGHQHGKPHKGQVVLSLAA